MKSKMFLIISVVLVLSGCGLLGEKSSLDFSGTVEMTEHSLGAKAAGRIDSLLVDEGSQVKKEELIATLDRYAQFKKDYERVEQLFKDGGTNKQALEYAALNLDDQQVIAPMDGVILVKVKEVGEVVNAGAAVVVLGDQSSLWVRIFVPENIVNQIKVDQKASIHFDGLKENYQGHITYISSKAEFTPRNVQTQEERVTQTFAVKVVIDNPPASLHPGVAADIRIQPQE